MPTLHKNDSGIGYVLTCIFIGLTCKATGLLPTTCVQVTGINLIVILFKFYQGLDLFYRLIGKIVIPVRSCETGYKYLML